MNRSALINKAVENLIEEIVQINRWCDFVEQWQLNFEDPGFQNRIVYKGNMYVLVAWHFYNKFMEFKAINQPLAEGLPHLLTLDFRKPLPEGL
jgi:hypothetical protein